MLSPTCNNPAQNPPIVKFDYAELDDIIYFANKKIDEFQKQNPAFNRYKVINTLAYKGHIPHDFVRMSVLHNARYWGRTKPETLQKWGIVAIPQAWGTEFQLLENWTRPSKKTATQNPKKAPQKIAQKTPKNEQKNNPNTAGLKAWKVYSDLPLKYPNFTPINPNKPTQNPIELQDNFNDFLDYENLSIEIINQHELPKYNLHGFLKNHAHNHSICTCLEHRRESTKADGTPHGVDIYVDKTTGKIKVGNTIRCRNPFCNFCYGYDGKKQFEKAKQVQKTHIQNGGKCLLANFTAPHSDKTNPKKFIKKLNLAYGRFVVYVRDLGLGDNLKRMEYGYTKANAHHNHIHVAYAVNADMDTEELQSLLQEIWYRCLVETGLVNERNKKSAEKYSFTLDENDRAFEYVAKVHATQFELSDLPKIKDKYNNGKALTIFELAFLTQCGGFDNDKFNKVYNELLGAWHGVTPLKYSRGFLQRLGLVVKDTPQPIQALKSSDMDTQTHTATIVPPKPQKPKTTPKPPTIKPIYTTIQQYAFNFDNDSEILNIRTVKHQRRGKYHRKKIDNPNQLTIFSLLRKKYAKKPPKLKAPPKPRIKPIKDLPPAPPRPKPKYRYIYDTPPDLVFLCEIQWETWCELKKDNEHFLLLAMLQNAVNKGYFRDFVPSH